MSDKSEMELVADCHGVTEVNIVTALRLYNTTSSIESLERLERAHELVTALTVEVFPGSLQTEQKTGSWQEALENEMKRGISEESGIEKPGGIQYSTILQQQLHDAPGGCGCQNAASVD